MTQNKTSWSFYSLFWRGIIMGIADLIPGVSGGTIAFITGIYDDLLESLKSLNPVLFLRKKKGKGFKKSKFLFLIAIGSGIGTSFLVFARYFYALLTHPIYFSFLYALFFGLIIASITLCLKEVRTNNSKWKMKESICLLFGIVIALVLSFLPTHTLVADAYNIPLTSNVDVCKKIIPVNYDKMTHSLNKVHKADVETLFNAGFISADALAINHLNKQTIIVRDLIAENPHLKWIDPLYIVSGMVAISAMLLPGISGSYMLTVIGVYPIAIQSFVSFTEHLKRGSFESHSFFILFNLLGGIIIGLMIFSRVVSYLLNHKRRVTLIVLIGFMIGSLPCIWPFWKVDYIFSTHHLKNEMILTNPIFPTAFDLSYVGLILIAALGFNLVWIVEKISSRKSLEPV